MVFRQTVGQYLHVSEGNPLNGLEIIKKVKFQVHYLDLQAMCEVVYGTEKYVRSISVITPYMN